MTEGWSTEEEEDPEDELRAFADGEPLSKERKFRHLVEDLVMIIPHSKKESKIEKKQAKE